mmetsp:Transcript_10351/g.38168  ORF Transcript_10351/g.38168 Transcript_10351/m.38168 type:complete len:236 (+) Transcript_10351:1003-1710(+)
MKYIHLGVGHAAENTQHRLDRLEVTRGVDQHSTMGEAWSVFDHPRGTADHVQAAVEVKLDQLTQRLQGVNGPKHGLGADCDCVWSPHAFDHTRNAQLVRLVHIQLQGGLGVNDRDGDLCQISLRGLRGQRMHIDRVLLQACECCLHLCGGDIACEADRRRHGHRACPRANFQRQGPDLRLFALLQQLQAARIHDRVLLGQQGTSGQVALRRVQGPCLHFERLAVLQAGALVLKNR